MIYCENGFKPQGECGLSQKGLFTSWMKWYESCYNPSLRHWHSKFYAATPDRLKWQPRWHRNQHVGLLDLELQCSPTKQLCLRSKSEAPSGLCDDLISLMSAGNASQSICLKARRLNTNGGCRWFHNLPHTNCRISSYSSALESSIEVYLE